MASLDIAALRRARERRRRIVVTSIAVPVIVAVVGTVGVVAVQRTPWWQCRWSAASVDGIDYRLVADDAGHGRDDVVAAAQALPGVGDLLGWATLDAEMTVAAGPAGSLVLGTRRYDPDATGVDVVLDPRSGTTWAREQVGQHAAPIVVGDEVVELAAVPDGPYRTSVLSTDDGSVRGCIDVERFGGNVSDAAFAVDLEGETVALSTPLEEGGAALTAYGLDGLAQEWQASLPSQARSIVWQGSSVLASQTDSHGLFSRNGFTWRIAAFDAATGEPTWTWPAADEVGVALAPMTDRTGDLALAIRVPTDVADGPATAIGVDAATGEQRWSQALPEGTSTVAVGDLALYRDGDALVVLDLASGAERWRAAFPPGRVPRIEDAVAWGEDLLLSGSDGTLLLDGDTGETLGSGADVDGDPRWWVTDDSVVVELEDVITDEQELLVFARDD